jgi:hypothetical protein
MNQKVIVFSAMQDRLSSICQWDFYARVWILNIGIQAVVIVLPRALNI